MSLLIKISILLTIVRQHKTALPQAPERKSPSGPTNCAATLVFTCGRTCSLICKTCRTFSQNPLQTSPSSPSSPATPPPPPSLRAAALLLPRSDRLPQRLRRRALPLLDERRVPERHTREGIAAAVVHARGRGFGHRRRLRRRNGPKRRPFCSPASPPQDPQHLRPLRTAAAPAQAPRRAAAAIG